MWKENWEKAFVQTRERKPSGSTRAADIDQEVTTSNGESMGEVMITEMRESG